MDFVTRNGVALRTNARFHLHHDKTIIVDGLTVRTGSFNYAPSADLSRSLTPAGCCRTPFGPDGC